MQEFQDKFGSVTVSDTKGFGGIQITSGKSERTFAISANDLVVKFEYLATKKISRNLTPQYEEVEAQYYTSLLEEEEKDLLKATSILIEEGELTVNRVGVVATTNLLAESLPPGVKKILGSLNNIYSGKLAKSSTILTPIIHDDENIQDQCHHTIDFDLVDKGIEEPDEVVFVMDWQRGLKKQLVSEDV